MRSAMVVDWLRRNGFPGAVNLAGGIDAWSREVDPSVPRYR
jgi:rhodanese-related sulfurtransferase